jgi:uncharacterized hydrophobic protein (TIGR00271 family)
VLHLRIVTPPDRTAQIQAILCEDVAVWNVIVLPGAGVRPPGDVVLADVAREDASVIVARLRELGLERDGSIAIENVDTAISDGARAAIEAARGEEADAVVWEQVEAQTSEQATLSQAYLAFMVLASAIAAAGIFTDSAILIVGAMVLGPEFGPLAGICVATVQRRPGLVRASLTAFVVGVALAVATTWLLSEALIAAGLEPESFSLSKGVAQLISSPDAYTVLVAACAGIAGMLSLTTAKSGALIGVLVSITTIPAISEIGVAAAEGDGGAARGAATQLGVNVATIIGVGIVTLAIQRAAYERRRRSRSDSRSPA